MIARLKGLIESIGEDSAVIDVNGVGYLVFCSGRTLGRLAVGEAAALSVETHVREDHIHLYGFSDTTEREWFRLLTTVQGVGARVGLAILTVMTPLDLSRAIAAGDKAPLTRAAGVGPKLAGRIVSELKEKVAAMPVSAGGAPIAATASAAAATPAGAGAAQVSAGPGEGGAATVAVTVTEDATSALVNLGYRRMEAYSAVARAARDQGDGATTQSLITAALRELAQV